MRYSEQITALLDLLYRTGEPVAGRVGRAVPVEFTEPKHPTLWPSAIATNALEPYPDEVYIRPATVDEEGTPISRLIFAEVETAPAALPAPPTFVLRQYGGAYLVGYVLDEPVSVERAAESNEVLAAILGGKRGTYPEPRPRATTNPGDPVVTRERAYADPTRFCVGIPGCARVSTFAYSARPDSPRIGFTTFTGTTYEPAALAAMLERN